MAAVSWRKLFSRKILERGFEYYNNGLVSELCVDHNAILAKIEGTASYSVQIYLDGGDIIEMFCTCPYAEEGNYCKHMAAALFQWERDPMGRRQNAKSSHTAAVGETVTSSPDNASRDPLPKNSNNSKMNAEDRPSSVSEREKALCRRELDSIQKRYTPYNSEYINFARINDYLRDMTGLLDRKIPLLIDTGLYIDAFELTVTAYRITTDVIFARSNIAFSSFTSKCKHYIEQILPDSDTEIKRSMHSILMSACKVSSVRYNKFLYECLLNYFCEEEFLTKSVELIDSEIAQANMSKDNLFLFYLVESRAHLMRKLEYPDHEIRAFHLKFDFLSATRKKAIDLALDSECDLKAIELIKEARFIGVDKLSYTRYYSEELIRLYEKHQMTDDCKSELLAFIEKFPLYRLNYIRKLKRLMAEDEWTEYREKFLSDERHSSVHYELMAEEKMYRRLLDEIETDPSLRDFFKFEGELRTVYPEEVRDVLFVYLQSRMYHANQKSEYIELINHLKRLKSYPDGAEIAQALADEWKIVFSKRRSLLEELTRAGF